MVIMSGNNFRTCLINLFNSCLRSGAWPWTDTRVLFIKKHMKADYSNPSAYRPISISSHIGKVFERILNRRLMRYMLSEKLIDIEQEGFLPKKNTVRSQTETRMRPPQEEQIMCSSHKSRLREGFR